MGNSPSSRDEQGQESYTHKRKGQWEIDHSDLGNSDKAQENSSGKTKVGARQRENRADSVQTHPSTSDCPVTVTAVGETHEVTRSSNFRQSGEGLVQSPSEEREEMLRNSVGKRIYTKKHLESLDSCYSQDGGSVGERRSGQTPTHSTGGRSSTSSSSGGSRSGGRRRRSNCSNSSRADAHSKNSSGSESSGSQLHRHPSTPLSGTSSMEGGHNPGAIPVISLSPSHFRQSSLLSQDSDVFEENGSSAGGSGRAQRTSSAYTSVGSITQNITGAGSGTSLSNVNMAPDAAPIQLRGNGSILDKKLETDVKSNKVANESQQQGAKVEKLTALSLGRPVPKRWGSRRTSQLSSQAQLSTRLALDQAVDLIRRKKLGARKIKEQNIMMRAVDAGHLECVQECIKAGCNMNGKHGNGTPAIIYAVRSDNNASDVLQLLIKAGAVIDQPSISGETALHSAIFHKDAECVRLLLEAGANVNARWQGTTPINLAIQTMNQYITAITLHAGAQVTHLSDTAGENPLHHLLRLFHLSTPSPDLASALWITLQADGRAVTHLNSFTSRIPGYSSQQLIYRMSETGLWSGGGIGAGAARHVVVWLVRLGYTPDRGENATIKQEDPAVHNWMEQYVGQPPPLADLCIRAVRQRMQGNCVYAVKRLGSDISESVKKQLLLEESNLSGKPGVVEEEEEDPYYSFLMMDGEGLKDPLENGSDQVQHIPDQSTLKGRRKVFGGDIRGVVGSPTPSPVSARSNKGSEYNYDGETAVAISSDGTSICSDTTSRSSSITAASNEVQTLPLRTPINGESIEGNQSMDEAVRLRSHTPLTAATSGIGGGLQRYQAGDRSSSSSQYSNSSGIMRRTSADTRAIESALMELDSTLEAFGMSGDTDTEGDNSHPSTPHTGSRPTSGVSVLRIPEESTSVDNHDCNGGAPCLPSELRADENSEINVSSFAPRNHMSVSPPLPPLDFREPVVPTPVIVDLKEKENIQLSSGFPPVKPDDAELAVDIKTVDKTQSFNKFEASDEHILNSGSVRYSEESDSLNTKPLSLITTDIATDEARSGGTGNGIASTVQHSEWDFSDDPIIRSGSERTEHTFAKRSSTSFKEAEGASESSLDVKRASIYSTDAHQASTTISNSHSSVTSHSQSNEHPAAKTLPTVALRVKSAPPPVAPKSHRHRKQPLSPPPVASKPKKPAPVPPRRNTPPSGGLYRHSVQTEQPETTSSLAWEDNSSQNRTRICSTPAQSQNTPPSLSPSLNVEAPISPSIAETVRPFQQGARSSKSNGPTMGVSMLTSAQTGAPSPPTPQPRPVSAAPTATARQPPPPVKPKPNVAPKPGKRDFNSNIGREIRPTAAT